MTTKQKQTNLSLDDETKQKLEEASNKTNNSMSKIVRELVRLFLPELYKRLGYK